IGLGPAVQGRAGVAEAPDHTLLLGERDAVPELDEHLDDAAHVVAAPERPVGLADAPGDLQQLAGHHRVADLRVGDPVLEPQVVARHYRSGGVSPAAWHSASPWASPGAAASLGGVANAGAVKS